METFFDRLRSVINDHGDGKPTVFAKKIGIPVSTFHNIINGQFPKAEHLLLIYEKCGVSIDWLLSGKGSPYINKEEDRHGEPADLVLIGQVIEHLEELLQEEGTNLPPAKKRRLIELLYKHFKKIGETADKSTTREYLRLVAA